MTPKPAARHGWRRYLLGTLLMARSGRSTRTVRIADRLTLCPSREYSIMLRGKRRGVRARGAPCLGAGAAWGRGAARTERYGPAGVFQPLEDCKSPHKQHRCRDSWRVCSRHNRELQGGGHRNWDSPIAAEVPQAHISPSR